MKKSWFFLVLLLAFVLRVYRLNLIPVELFGDELDVGYQAYSILKSAKDIRGYKFPLYFHSLSERRAPLYLYTTVPFVALFGLNEWGVRLPAVVFGVLDVFLIYLLARRLKNQTLAVWSSVVLAISPWHLHYSRAGFEVTLLLALILAGGVFFQKALVNFRFLPLSVFLFVLAIYTYSTAVLFVPLFFFLLCFFWRTALTKIPLKVGLFCLAVILIGALPFLGGFFFDRSQERFSRISIFSDPKLVESIINKRSGDGAIGRVFHNKVTRFGQKFVSNYLTAFSPGFLYFNGDPNPRHSAGTAELYLLLLPFGCWGLFSCLRNFAGKENRFLVFWLIISPLPAALTVGGGEHATRLFLMLPPLAILTAEGISRFLAGVNYRYGKTAFLLLALAVSFTFFWHQYSHHSLREYWQFWHYGYKEIFQELAGVEKDYERIIINNSHEPALIRLLFWTKKDPFWLREVFVDDKGEAEILPGFVGFRVGKYYFGRLQNKEGLKELLKPKTLYLAFQQDEVPGDWNWEENPPSAVRVIKLVRTPSGEPYIYLLEGEL